MSVKDVRDYYDKVCEQYLEMKNELADFTEEANKGLIEPERIEQAKQAIQPLMNNYERITYIMFLLNQPANKKKVARYKKQQKKKIANLSEVNSLDAVLKENECAIKNINSNA